MKTSTSQTILILSISMYLIGESCSMNLSTSLSMDYDSKNLPSVENLLANFSNDLKKTNKSYSVVKFARKVNNSGDANDSYIALVKSDSNGENEYINLEFAGEKGSCIYPI